MYKIINTTDGKNLGLIIESGQKEYFLRNNYTFTPATERISNNRLYLSNTNYIIEAMLIKEAK
jgi:hypothetical protein